MKPLFHVLQRNYSSSSTVRKKELFAEIGWNDFIDNPAYDNTCSIRVSLALIKSGVDIRGRIAIKEGVHQGRFIEPDQAKLSLMLAEMFYLGEPEKFKTSDAEKGIGNRSGIVSFWRMPGYLNGQRGHIDIVTPVMGGVRRCGSGCFWESSEVWFWKLA